MTRTELQSYGVTDGRTYSLLGMLSHPKTLGFLAIKLNYRTINSKIHLNTDLFMKRMFCLPCSIYMLKKIPLLIKGCATHQFHSTAHYHLSLNTALHLHIEGCIENVSVLSVAICFYNRICDFFHNLKGCLEYWLKLKLNIMFCNYYKSKLCLQPVH